MSAASLATCFFLDNAVIFSMNQRWVPKAAVWRLVKRAAELGGGLEEASAEVNLEVERNSFKVTDSE